MPPSFTSLSLGEFLEQTGAKRPTPGGGAVASVVGALGVALGQMVVAYSIGKKNLAEHQEFLAQAAQRLSRARDVLLRLADEDAAAYGLVNELSKLEAWDPRREELPGAQLASAQVPLLVAGVCVEVLRLLIELEPKSNVHLRSDLAIAAILSEATARSAAWNVVVNLPALPAHTQATMADELRSTLARVHSLAQWASPEQQLEVKPTQVNSGGI
jgi:formiminotetrahydrofolate cyclodeaminase